MADQRGAGYMYRQALSAHRARDNDMGVKDDPHEIRRKTSSSVKTPRDLAGGTARRLESSVACRTHSLVARSLSLAAR